MPDYEFSSHAKEMIKERQISEAWVWRSIDSPDTLETGSDGNLHYIKSISEHGNRVLRVIVNPHNDPHRIVTVFFDRRLRRKK